MFCRKVLQVYFCFLNHFLYRNCSIQRSLRAQKWKSSDNQQRICYIGDLPDDFLQMKFCLSTDGTNRKLSTDIQSGLTLITYLNDK